MQQRGIILDKLVPFMRCHAPKANRGIGFVLCDLHAQERRSVHSTKSFEHAILITNSDTHWLPHLLSLRFSSFNETFCRFDSDTGFLEGVFCHRNVLSFCRLTSLLRKPGSVSLCKICFLTSTQQER